LYDSVDLFISPSRKEAFGYAVVEAAYSKCQVLASNVPGQNTMMDIPGIYWVDLKDSESLKKAIEEAIIKKETNKIDEIREEQKKYVVKNYNIDKWVDANIKLYDTYFGKVEKTNKPMFYITRLKRKLGLLK
jgi:glycosyltransferase involved in cell wall biosynthesis